MDHTKILSTSWPQNHNTQAKKLQKIHTSGSLLSPHPHDPMPSPFGGCLQNLWASLHYPSPTLLSKRPPQYSLFSSLLDDEITRVWAIVDCASNALATIHFHPMDVIDVEDNEGTVGIVSREKDWSREDCDAVALMAGQSAEGGGACGWVCHIDRAITKH